MASRKRTPRISSEQVRRDVDALVEAAGVKGRERWISAVVPARSSLNGDEARLRRDHERRGRIVAVGIRDATVVWNWKPGQREGRSDVPIDQLEVRIGSNEHATRYARGAARLYR